MYGSSDSIDLPRIQGMHHRRTESAKDHGNHRNRAGYSPYSLHGTLQVSIPQGN